VKKQSNKKQPSILLVEDNAFLALSYQAFLRHEPWQITHVNNGADALAYIQGTTPEVILLDLGLPDIDGMDVLKYVHENQISSDVIIITGQGSAEIEAEAKQLLAFDFIEKPFNAKRLIVTVRNALQHRHLVEVVNTYKEKFDRERYHDFTGSSLAMQAVYHMIDNAASSKATVFITGESGTGKELCARALHQQSPRRDKPFIAVNCAAIPRDLMESEMFGHVKGSFTGAVNDREGAASHAHEGTLFLDEICEMDLDLQTKLLRFIQTGTFQKVGGRKLETVDVRFVCATNRNPLEEVQAGRFREDLYYRLHVIPISLPPLRDRDSDVLIIAQELLERFTEEEGRTFVRFSPEVQNLFLHYEWPGNVRQLQNVIRNIVVLNQGDEVESDMLPSPLNNFIPSRSSTRLSMSTQTGNEVLLISLPVDMESIRPLWEIEKQVIERVIELCGGSVPKAATLLEVSPSTLYRKRQGWTE
jgi:two-component system repressor protein LuxO